MYGGLFHIWYTTNLVGAFGSADFTTALNNVFRDSTGHDYGKKYRVIEYPSLLNIDDEKAGTFVYSVKSEDNSTPFGSQYWLVFVKNHAYLILFGTSTDLFDSAEIAEIRENFINSIKFMGVIDQTNSTVSYGR